MQKTKTTKRLLIVALIAVFILAAFTGAELLKGKSIPVYAAGSPDYSWYSNPSANSFTINSADQLAGFANIVNGTAAGQTQANFSGKTITLANDINLNVAPYNTGTGWTPIGTSATINERFRGTFNGAGHEITGLYINNTSLTYAGLFGYTYLATIKNLGLVNVSVRALDYVGGLAGTLSSGITEKCYITGSITSTLSGSNVAYCGGMAGLATSGTIKNCYISVSITAAGFRAGGFFGTTGTAPEITYCYATGTVSGTLDVGGLVGYSAQPGDTIINCAALNMQVSGTSAASRVVGSGNGTFSNNYAYDRMTSGGISFSTTAKLYGTNLTRSRALTAAFWTAAANWTTIAWDTSVWDIANGRLPTLKGFAVGTQSGDFPLTDAQAVSETKDTVTWSAIRGSNIEQTNVTSNLALFSTGTDRATITWTSTNTAVISNTGVVTRPSYTNGDASITLTATIRAGNTTDTVNFELLVPKLTQTDAEKVTQAKDALTWNIIKGTNTAQDNVTGNLALTTFGEAGTTISWASANPSVISALGVVTRPAFADGDATVILQATITKGTSSDTVLFTVTVKKMEQTGPSDTEAVAADKAALTWDIIKGTNTAQNSVTSNLALPVSGANGTAISWSSSNSNVVSNNGTVTHGNNDTNITLIATITKGTASDTVTFNLTVKKTEQAGPSDTDLVAADKAALTWDIIKGTNTAQNNLISNLTLPVSGANGTTIFWSSSSMSTISSDGTVTRDENGDINITLIATITKGGASDTVTFNLTVKKTEQTVATFTITVTGGEANMTSCIEGTTVTLTAATAPEGKKFKEWKVVSGGVTLTGNTFIMKTDNVVIEAVWENITNDGLPIGAIIGIAGGILIIGIFCVYWFVIRKKKTSGSTGKKA